MYKTTQKLQLLITAEQLTQANAESIRLGLNRTLDLPLDFPRLTFPIADVFQDNNSARLTILYWESVEAASSGQEPDIMVLDVTRAWFKKLEKSSRRILRELKD